MKSSFFKGIEIKKKKKKSQQNYFLELRCVSKKIILAAENKDPVSGFLGKGKCSISLTKEDSALIRAQGSGAGAGQGRGRGRGRGGRGRGGYWANRANHLVNNWAPPPATGLWTPPARLPPATGSPRTGRRQRTGSTSTPSAGLL